MNDIDKILTRHRAALEEEPLDGHLDRFRQRLKKSNLKPSNPISGFLKVAAVLVIILLSANLIVTLRTVKPGSEESAAINNELNEASFYYTNSINNGIRDLEKMASEGIGSQQEILQIKHELSEMDSMFISLQKDYKINPNDERIINAMIEYYQTKLDIVNTIKTDLEKVKQQLKIKNHENAEI